MRVWPADWPVPLIRRDVIRSFVTANPANPAAWALGQLAARLGSPAAAAVTVSESGELGTTDYRLFYSGKDGSKVSVWHDVALFNDDGTMNMIVEIPRFTRAKMEISTDEQFNPIKQDTSKGLPREYKWGDMLFNYGALPQTWEDPAFTHPATSAAGDNDPVDVIDVGSASHPIGSIIKVKPLGVLGMIDQGEMDWKVIAISTADPMAAAVNSIADLRIVQPTAVEAFDGWMRDYKTADGKPTNHIEYVAGWDTPEFAKAVISEANEHWASLVASGRREL